MTGNTLVDVLAGWFFVAIPVALVLGPCLRANRRATSVAYDHRGAVAVSDRPSVPSAVRSDPAASYEWARAANPEAVTSTSWSPTRLHRANH